MRILLLIFLLFFLAGCNADNSSNDLEVSLSEDDFYEEYEEVDDTFIEEEYFDEEFEEYFDEEIHPTDVDKYGVYAHDNSEYIEDLIDLLGGGNFDVALEYIEEYINFDDPNVDAAKVILETKLDIENLPYEASQTEKNKVKEKAYKKIEKLDFAALHERILFHLELIQNELGLPGENYKPNAEQKEYNVITYAQSAIELENYDQCLFRLDDHIETEGEFISIHAETEKVVRLICEIHEFGLSKSDVLEKLQDIDPEYEHELMGKYDMRDFIDLLKEKYGITYQNWLDTYYSI